MLNWIKSKLGITKASVPAPSEPVANEQPSISIKEVLGEKVMLGIPLNLNEAREVVRREETRLEETKAAHKRKEFPTHISKEDKLPDTIGQQKFLTYALGLIEKEQPFYFKILSARMRGLSCKKIARSISSIKGCHISEREVQQKEAEAVKFMKATIENLRQHGVPIFGEPEGKPKSSIIQAA
jgi:hypothetical protein